MTLRERDGLLTEPTVISLDEGVDLMVSHDYDGEIIRRKFAEWIDRLDVVLIFQNEDLGHSALGHVMAMPFMPGSSLPKHGPDNAATGLGWRYILKHIINPKGHTL